MKLAFVPETEFARILALPLSAGQRAGAFADACRINTLYSIMRAGSGHIGSSLSAMDVVSWLHLEVLPRTAGALYFSSKGHDAPGLYTVMAALGQLPFEKLHSLRRIDGLPGHPDIATPGIPCNTGSLGMGISKAKGMITAARLDSKECAVFVLTGDGELQEGQIWESLQGASNHCFGELTVIVDHNKIQSDTWIEKVSPLGDLEAKFRAFGWEVARCDGHDFGELERVFTRFAEITDKPKVLIADTIKGCGVSFMEQTSAAGEFEFYKFHSGAPSLDHFADAVAELRGGLDEVLRPSGGLFLEEVDLPDRTPPSGQRLVAAYGAELVQQAQRRPDIVVFDADLMLDCGLVPFAEKFPQRFVECGIAEQDMVSQAGGLALRGKLPIVHSFACFLTPRANEQIYNNATERSKIIYVGSLAGVLPAGPGHSHQSVRDIALLAQIPGLTLLEPCCESEARAYLEWAIDSNPSSTYIRLTSIPVEVPFDIARPSLRSGVGSVLRDGRDIAIFGYGPVLLSEAWHAVETLAKDSISAKLVALPWLNKLDAEWLEDVLKGISAAIFLDNHYSKGGQGEMLCRALAEAGIPTRAICVGIDDIPACGLNSDVLALHGLDYTAIAATARQFLSRSHS